MVKFTVLGKEFNSSKVAFTIGHLSDLWIDDMKVPAGAQEKDELEFEHMNPCNTVLPGFSFNANDARRTKKQVFIKFAEKYSIPVYILHDN